MGLQLQEAAFDSDLYRELLVLRNEILRKPLGLPVSGDDTKLDGQEYHLAALQEGSPIACVLLRPLTDKVIKLRQMAVAPQWQGKGVGAQLVRFAEKIAKERGFEKVEMHARKAVQGFYEKLGYQAEGEDFIEVTVVHVKMAKSLAVA